jgi:hypothetical protein
VGVYIGRAVVHLRFEIPLPAEQRLDRQPKSKSKIMGRELHLQLPLAPTSLRVHITSLTQHTLTEARCHNVQIRKSRTPLHANANFERRKIKYEQTSHRLYYAIQDVIHKNRFSLSIYHPRKLIHSPSKDA